MARNSDLKNRLRSQYLTAEEKQEEERQAAPSAVRGTGKGKIWSGLGMIILSTILTAVFSGRQEHFVFCGLSLVGGLTIEIGLCNLVFGKRWDDLSWLVKGLLFFVALIVMMVVMVVSLMLGDTFR